MSTLIQVILINLIVSFDNISVIALAARGLTPKKANTARLVGIWLSLALKLVFTFMVGWLFTITWLHIRLIGGMMLIYVIVQMLRDTSNHKEVKSDEKFIKVIFTIIAADISMSLDNVIAVISIVVDDAGNITAHGLSMAFLGFAISVPILLIASEYIINLINRYAVLFALAAGYLGYIAANMIFEDELLESFFHFMQFPFVPQLAVVVGVVVTYISWIINRKSNRLIQ
ncbi:MAG: YjbE family putative metal transport protein [Defluviitaleaceae bacterium]|nr:YjbE family putative metal transport protein [Defluviitaleaceae bacterium]